MWWIDLVFEVILVIVVGSFGIIGNSLLVKIFIKSENKLNFHWLMIALAIYDVVYIILSMIVFALPELFEEYKSQGYHFYIAPKSVSMMQIALTGSIYCTVGISLERYMTVCHPFFLAEKNLSAKMYIIPIVVFSVVYNTAHFFEMRTIYNEGYDDQDDILNNETSTQEQLVYTDVLNTSYSSNDVLVNFPKNNSSCYSSTNIQDIATNLNMTKYSYEVELTLMRKNKYYYIIYIICLNFIFNGLVPFAIIITLNTFMYRQLKIIERTQAFTTQISSRSLASCQHRHHGYQENEPSIKTNKRLKISEVMLAKVSIVIVFVFIMCHSIKWIPNIYELLQRLHTEEECIHWPPWVESITQISHFLTVLNSSVNFYIYRATHYDLPSISCLKYNKQRKSDEIECEEF